MFGGFKYITHCIHLLKIQRLLMQRGPEGKVFVTYHPGRSLENSFRIVLKEKKRTHTKRNCSALASSVRGYPLVGTHFNNLNTFSLSIRGLCILKRSLFPLRISHCQRLASFFFIFFSSFSKHALYSFNKGIFPKRVKMQHSL